MAYEFKKLSEVLEVETANSTAKVLIEEEGIIKKVPKDEVGGLKEVDWEIITNKPKIVTSWNDLEDKPFGVSGELIEVFPQQTVTAVRPGSVMRGVVNIPIKVDTKYIFKINDKTYELTSYINENGVIAIGESSLPNDKNIPFVYIPSGDNFSWLQSLGNPITLTVYEDTREITPLDYKFMPEGYPKVERKMVEIVPEQSVTGEDTNGTGVKFRGGFESNVAIEAGKEYTISINGEKLKSTAKGVENSPPGMQFVILGNGSFMMPEEDTGEPIGILWSGTGYQVDWSAEYGETITISIIEVSEIVTPLDPKFVGASGSAILNFSRDSDDSLNICDNTFDVFDNAYKNRKPINATFTEYTLNEHHIGYLSSYISWDDGSYVLTFRRLEGGSGFSYGLSKGRVVKQIRWYPDGRIEDYEIVA